MRVKLIRKLADILNGIDLTKVCVGDVVDLKTRHAVLLVAEGWAEPVKNVKVQEPEDRQNR
jgi:hypothetical protein